MIKVLIAGAVVTAGVSLAMREQTTPSAADVPLLVTPLWQGEAAAYGQQLLLRRDAQASRDLLIKHSGHAGAYRYDGSTRSLTAVSDEQWTRAGGEVAECGKQGPPSTQVLRIDQLSHRLFAGSRELSVAGPVALALTESPSHRAVAVLSASGPAQPSLLPFLAAGGAAGQRFHQVVSLPDAALTGAVRVPVQRNEDVLSGCWSADEKAIVYYHVLFAYLSVVER